MKKFFQKRMSLALTLSLFVFLVMITTFLVSGIITYILSKFGLIDMNWVHPRDVGNDGASPFRFLIALFAFCLLLGHTVTVFFSKKTLRPIRCVVDATNSVAKGNFDVKVDLKGISELEALSVSFNKMTDELASTETLKRDFVNNFSHEFKTPIVSIRGFAKLLKKGDLSEDEKNDYLDIIIAESERLSTLSTQILNLANYEHVEILADKVEFRLDEQIRKSILLLEQKWTEKELHLEVDLAPARYFGNEDLTQQIWLNLLDNAIKFSYSGAALRISLNQNAESWIIAIQDEGCGMNPQTQAHIFEKFYRADESHHKMGNGIGLAIVDRLLKLMDGEISVESELDKGSTFTVNLKKIPVE